MTHPTRWTNQFYRNLLKYDWEVHKGPGGHNQWRPKHKATAPAAVKAEPLPNIMSRWHVLVCGRASPYAVVHLLEDLIAYWNPDQVL